VQVVEKPEFNAWLAEQREAALAEYETVGKEWTMDELMAKGEEVYTRNCATCHQANGQGIPPAFPSLVGQGMSVGSIDDHIDIVLNGAAGTAMQAFGAQLNPAEIAAVITYERNAWGNNTGDAIQPKDINALQNGG